MGKYNTEETKKLAVELSQKLKPGSILALKGDLGSGKTTFTAYLANALGFSNRVQSPTFVILRKYKAKENNSIKIINHLDLYRLTSEQDLIELDLEELMTEPDAITIIEWPDIAKNLLPKDTIFMNFKYLDENEREIDVQNLY